MKIKYPISFNSGFLENGKNYQSIAIVRKDLELNSYYNICNLIVDLAYLISFFKSLV